MLVAGTERFWSVVRIEQVDDDGQVHFVAVPADDPAALRLLARSGLTSASHDVPTMYHANGKQRGTAGNNGDLTRRRDRVRTALYQGECLTPAEGS